MATSTTMDEVITCQICMEIYEEPQSLKCRHVLCLKCTEKIKANNCVVCPICKTKSEMSEVCIAFKTRSIVDIYQIKRANTADSSCESGDTIKLFRCNECLAAGNEITHICKSCDFPLCDGCVNSQCHKAKSHSLKGFQDLTDSFSNICDTNLTEIGKLRCGYKQTMDKLLQEFNVADLKAEETIEAINKKEQAMKKHCERLRVIVNVAKAEYCQGIQDKINDIQHAACARANEEKVLQFLLKDAGDKDVLKTNHYLKLVNKLMSDAGSSPVHKPFELEVVSGSEEDFIDINCNTSPGCKEETGALSLVEHDALEDVQKDFKYISIKQVAVDSTMTDVFLDGNKLYLYDGCRKLQIYSLDLKLLSEVHFAILTNYTLEIRLLIAPNYFLVSTSDGIYSLNDRGMQSEQITRDRYGHLGVYEDKVFAHLNETNEVHVYKPTKHHWTKEANIYLQYHSADKKHDPSKIRSFLMYLDNIYISDSTSVYLMNMKGELVKTYTIDERNGKPLKNPIVCQIHMDRSVVVADRGNARVVVFSGSGEHFVPILRRPLLSLQQEQGLFLSAAVMDQKKDSVFVRYRESTYDDLRRRKKRDDFYLEMFKFQNI